MERQALRGLLSNSGKVFECVDESFDGDGKIRHARCVAHPALPRKPRQFPEARILRHPAFPGPALATQAPGCCVSPGRTKSPWRQPGATDPATLKNRLPGYGLVVAAPWLTSKSWVPLSR